MDNKIPGYAKGQLETVTAKRGNAHAEDEMDYQQSVRIIGEELQKTKQSFIKIGWHLKYIKDRGLYGKDGYSNIYEFAQGKFHISQPTATRFMNLCTEFSAGEGSAELDKKYEKFTVSQLIEMLSLGSGQKEKVTPDMTVRQIREIKKEMKKEPPKGLPEGDCAPTGRHSSSGAYATSHKGGKEKAHAEEKGRQPGLPEFNNDAECREWLENTEAWGLWYEDGNIHARYYKYDFQDGSRLIAVRYRDACPQDMPGHPQQCGGDLGDNGGCYGEPYYHMIYSESYLEGHADRDMGSNCRNYTHETATAEELVEFLKEQKKTGGRGHSKEWRWVEFDTGHLGEEGVRDLPYLTRQYIKFYRRHGYVPRYLNVKNCTESKDYAPTLATGCGSFGAIGSVAIFNLVRNIQRVIDDETIGFDAQKKEIAGLLSIAGPEERKEALERLGDSRATAVLEDAADAFEGKIRFQATKLTLEDCFALMGLDQDLVRRCRELGVSDTHLYKAAGNGIVPNCVQYLMEHLYKAQVDSSYICTDERINFNHIVQEG